MALSEEKIEELLKIVEERDDVKLGPRGKRELSDAATRERNEQQRREHRQEILWRRYNFLDWTRDAQPKDILSEEMLNHYYQQILNNDVCVYCHSKTRMTRDHIRPKTEGFTLDWTNKAPACSQCNSSKGHTSMLEYLLERAEHDTIS